MAFPITQGQMEEESNMEDYLREQLFVTRSQLRSEGYANGDDVRQTVIQLVADENEQFSALRDSMQSLLDSTQALSASFSGQVALQAQSLTTNTRTLLRSS